MNDNASGWYCGRCQKYCRDEDLDTYECDSDGYLELVCKACGYLVEVKEKIMDSAKKSVEKVLEIAKKHGYACIVGFKKEFDAGHPADMYGGMTGFVGDVEHLFNDCLQPALDHYVGDKKNGE